jgi:hypothetical protein
MKISKISMYKGIIFDDVNIKWSADRQLGFTNRTRGRCSLQNILGNRTHFIELKIRKRARIKKLDKPFKQNLIFFDEFFIFIVVRT